MFGKANNAVLDIEDLSKRLGEIEISLKDQDARISVTEAALKNLEANVPVASTAQPSHDSESVRNNALNVSSFVLKCH